MDHYLSITYDLVEGGFLWGGLPCQRRKLVMLSFALAGMLGFFFGRFVAGVLGTFSMDIIRVSGAAHFFSFVFLAASLIFGAGLNAAYLIFRTPYEVKVTPNGPAVAKMGETPDTPLTPFLKGVISFISNALNTAMERRGR